MSGVTHYVVDNGSGGWRSLCGQPSMLRVTQARESVTCKRCMRALGLVEPAGDSIETSWAQLQRELPVTWAARIEASPQLEGIDGEHVSWRVALRFMTSYVPATIAEQIACPEPGCDGTGRVEIAQLHDDGSTYYDERLCPRCEGGGRVWSESSRARWGLRTYGLATGATLLEALHSAREQLSTCVASVAAP